MAQAHVPGLPGFGKPDQDHIFKPDINDPTAFLERMLVSKDGWSPRSVGVVVLNKTSQVLTSTSGRLTMGRINSIWGVEDIQPNSAGGFLAECETFNGDIRGNVGYSIGKRGDYVDKNINLFFYNALLHPNEHSGEITGPGRRGDSTQYVMSTERRDGRKDRAGIDDQFITVTIQEFKSMEDQIADIFKPSKPAGDAQSDPMGFISNGGKSTN